MNLIEWQNQMDREETRRAYTRWLEMFCAFNNCSPEDTLSWPMADIEDRMERFKTALLRSHKAGSSVKQGWSAIKRWYYDNHINVMRKCRGVRTTKTFYDHIATKEQLKLLLNKADLHCKVAFSLIAFSGMRPVDVEGLRFKAIKRSLSQNSDVLTIFVKQHKTDESYVTFLGPQGLAYLRAFLERRRSEGEEIGDNSFVVPMSRKAMRESFLRIAKRTIGENPTGEYFRKFRLYSLRKYFKLNNKMGEAESEFLMGHIEGLRGLSARYSGLADMNPMAIEELKQKYIKTLPNLETEISEVTVKSQVDVLSAKVALLEEMVLENGVMPDREHLRKRYVDEIGCGGGKSLKSEWTASEVQEILIRKRILKEMLAELGE